MAQTSLTNVQKIFTEDNGNEIVAVDDVSLEIDDGEFLVLVGPSGCGKSTTLRMLAGLESISSGEIALGDRVINDVSAQDRDIAMVFQSYALYPHMTVRENMSFGLEESTSMSDDEISAQVENAAEVLGITELLERTPSELSGGQQQRVALGRAIVREPSVFLMDEPLSNLDAKLRAEMRFELQRLQEQLGTTTIYVTHYQTEAMTMGDRIAILNDGRLQQVGTPLECYHQPANEFVAGFIGEPSMNLFDVDVIRDGEATTLRSDLFEYPLSDSIADSLEDASDLVFGIRPEDIVVDPSTGSARHTYDATINVVEPMGDENVVYLRFDKASRDAPTDQTVIATVGGMHHHESGETVSVWIDEEAIHLFDSQTGEAVRNRRLDPVESASTLH